MPLFTIKNSKLLPVKEQKFDLEKDIQALTETNLLEIFGLKFVKSELELNRLRVDTLAFNDETKSFVIIEYKRDRSFSVVDQGFAYLALMLNNKADFVLEYNENSNTKSIKREDVDWSQSKVIFIANSFTTYQREAISFKDLSFELWEVKKYDNGTLLFNNIQADKSSESINKITSSEVVKKVSKEIKSYTVDDVFPTSKKQRQLFEEIDEAIKSLDNSITQTAAKYYVGYHIGSDWRIFVSLSSRSGGVKVDLNRTEPKELTDPEKLAIYNKGSFTYYHQHISSFIITKTEDIAYALTLIRQVYKKHLKEFGQ